jgi:hypothetical protein
VFNATGRRIRELPLTAELVMDPAPVALVDPRQASHQPAV